MSIIKERKKTFFKSVRLTSLLIILVMGIASFIGCSSSSDGAKNGPNIISEYIQLPSIAQAPDTPSGLNRVAFLRTYDKNANNVADAVILFQDGSTAGP